jgi:hypothetical protein
MNSFAIASESEDEEAEEPLQSASADPTPDADYDMAFVRFDERQADFVELRVGTGFHDEAARRASLGEAEAFARKQDDYERGVCCLLAPWTGCRNAAVRCWAEAARLPQAWPPATVVTYGERWICCHAAPAVAASAAAASSGGARPGSLEDAQIQAATVATLTSQLLAPTDLVPIVRVVDQSGAKLDVPDELLFWLPEPPDVRPQQVWEVAHDYNLWPVDAGFLTVKAGEEVLIRHAAPRRWAYVRRRTRSDSIAASAAIQQGWIHTAVLGQCVDNAQ